uniref:Uncharacterized protein n=1 Tax=Globodera rostochiensis TaxID=31243 RepID=A0A914HXJ9_GLORO
MSSSGSNPWSKETGGNGDGIWPNSNLSGRTAARHALVLNKEKGTAEIEWTGQNIRTTKFGQPATTWTEIIREWPMSTLFIVCNEFCERFSYYGMRTVLTLYFLNVLKYSANTATMMFNGFTVLCYFTPLLGSILADGYIGKFKTIFFVSLLYTIGQCVLCLASVQNSASGLHPWLDILGLFIIGLGTGGIKPCVCSFGGDQFEPYQQKMLSLFFSIFYFSINAGSMISTFVSPLFRATPCLGQDSCYPMSFGIPAALMVLSTILFMSASYWYKKPPPTENIFSEVYKVGKKAVANKWRNAKGNNPPHWLDYYFDTHVCVYDSKCCQLRSQQGDPKACHKRQFVTDVKCLLRLLVVYLPAPMFWALYDQQGSRWLIQSVMMDCRLWGDTLLLPDQIMTLNAVLILLFIPMFQAFVYPIVSLCIKITSVQFID